MNGITSEVDPAILEQYFESYANYDVHKLMLEDKPRTLAYKNAILNSANLFCNKTVMDVGAGTGILSIFCAKAGARKVYAVEASKLAKVTRNVVKENNFQDVIEVIEKRVEDIDSSSIEKVDVIVSEWMGFYLVHEGMLESVIKARDLFLKENGSLFPDKAKLYVAPCQLPDFNSFWNDVYGVSMKCVGENYRKEKSHKPQVISVKESDILSAGKLIIWLDLKTVTCEEINSFGNEEHVLVCSKNGRYEGICTWFDVEFPDGSELSTSAESELTHWKQTVILLPESIEVSEGEPVAFKLNITKDESNSTRYNLELTMLDAEQVEHDLPCHCHLTKCIVTRTYMLQQENSDLIE